MFLWTAKAGAYLCICRLSSQIQTNMRELSVREQVCSDVGRGFHSTSWWSWGVEERYRQGNNKDNPFLKSILFMQTAGRGKGAEGTESQSSKSEAVPG